MNNLIENVRIALEALVSNKLRAVLTILGIGIGVAAVIVLIALGNATKAYLSNQFLGLGADVITVSNGSSFGGRATSRGVKLGMRDYALLQNGSKVPGVVSAVAVLNVRGPAIFAGNSDTSSVTGTEPGYFDLESRTVQSGRLFDSVDEQTNARVVVIGQTTAQTLFTNGEDPIGQTIRLGAVPFKIVGTLTPAGAGGNGQDQDDVILIPITTAQTKLSSALNVYGDVPISTIYLKVADTNQVQSISTIITSVLRASHNLHPTDDNDFSVSNAQATLDSLSSTLTALTIFLGVIGGISLLVGGIGVMNIMLVTVTERTREIGLRKAVGAKFRDILSQFLTEAVVLCFVGGFAGLLLAFGVVALLNALLQGLQPTVSLDSVVLSIGVVTLVGVFFGLYPASRAASLSPIKALRTE